MNKPTNQQVDAFWADNNKMLYVASSRFRTGTYNGCQLDIMEEAMKENHTWFNWEKK